jgi:murein L,D-transpeptidase YcbB/YkuD
MRGVNHYIDNLNLGLVTFNVAPEYYVMFKKPFRVRLNAQSRNRGTNPEYLVIKEVTEDGALALDADSKEWFLTRDFVFKHWGTVSWVYPRKDKRFNLAMGITSPGVMEVQKILNDIGYMIEANGFYDELTSKIVSKFQRDFGLSADGIIGPRTHALLFLMTN